MQTSESKHVYKAISEVAHKIAGEGISKSKKNQQQGYSFRGIDEIYNALAMHLATAGLVIIPKIISRDFREVVTKNGGLMSYVVVEAEYDFVSAVDGSTHTARVIGEAMDSADKATNKAMSAAYKYLCLQTFCIPTEGDNDADASTHERVPVALKETPTKKNTPKEEVPTEDEKLLLRNLVYSSTLVDDARLNALASINDCKDYKVYDKLRIRLQDLQVPFDQKVNPSQKDINKELLRKTA